MGENSRDSMSSATAAEPDLLGAQLGKYRVVECLSAGGMAQVYKAYQPDLDRYVALKVLNAALGQSPVFVQQFEREAKTLARLEHPNILPLYDSGYTPDGRPYLVVQYVRGGTLADCLGRPQPVAEVVRIVSQVGDALAYAHSQGVIHRDVKPSNILLTATGGVLLADFGIAAAPYTAGDSAGTRGYIASERRDGKPIDGRADIFSLGVILYELLSGKRFGEQNIVTRSLAANKLPPPIMTVITCSANWKVQNRYDLAEDFVTALHDAYNSTFPQGLVTQTASQAALEVTVMVLFALAGVGLIFYGLSLRDDGNRGVALGAGLVCFVTSVLFAVRDRSHPLTTNFLSGVMLIALGGALAVFPLSMLSDPFGINTLRGIWPLMIPGLLMLSAGIVSYARERRRTRAVAIRSAGPRRRRRPQLQEIRQTRNALVNTFIVIVGGGVVVWLISELAGRNAEYTWIRHMLLSGVVFSAAVLGLGLAVWYIYSQITAGAAAESSESQLTTASQVRQARLRNAYLLQRRIGEAVARARNNVLRDRLNHSIVRLDEWISYLTRLTQRLEDFERDPVIQRDRSTVPRAVDRLETRLAADWDDDIRVQDAARQTLAARQRQLQTLHELDQTMRRVDLRCEETVAALGELYSQVLLIDAKDIDGVRAQRVQAEIDAQVTALHAAGESLDEFEKVALFCDQISDLSQPLDATSRPEGEKLRASQG